MPGACTQSMTRAIILAESITGAQAASAASQAQLLPLITAA